MRLLILFLPGASLPRCLSRAASFAYPMLFPLTSSDRRTVVAPFQPSRNSNLAGDDYRSGSPRPTSRREDATTGRADESGERRTSRMMMPYSHPPLMRAKKRKGDARRRAAWLVAAGRRFLDSFQRFLFLRGQRYAGNNQVKSSSYSPHTNTKLKAR